MRASIGLGYRTLDHDAQHLLRRLSLLTVPNWSAWVVADATRALDRLVEVHLVEPAGRDAVGQARYRLHQLVADFARELVTPQEEHAALTELVAAWLALACAADERVGHGKVFANDIPVPAAVIQEDTYRFAEQAPRDWFEVERPGLIEAVGQACRLGRADLAGGLALRLTGFLALRGYDDDREYTLRQAIGCVRVHGSDHLLVQLLGALFSVCAQRNRFARLPEIAAEQLAVARRLNSPELLLRAFFQVGYTEGHRSRFAAAADWLWQAIAMGDRGEVPEHLIAVPLTTLARMYARSGQLARALPLHERAIAIDRATSSPSRQTALYLYHYAASLAYSGRLDTAEEALREALNITKEKGDELGTATLEQALGSVEIQRGRWTTATELLERSLKVHDRLGNDLGIGEVLRSQADLAFAERRFVDADELLRRALVIWRGIGDPLEMASTLARMERVQAAAGAPAAAAAFRREYRALLAELDLDESCLCVPATSPKADIIERLRALILRGAAGRTHRPAAALPRLARPIA